MPYFPCKNNMNVMFYSFGIGLSLKDITAFYYAEKLLHELLRIYLEKIVLYQLVKSTKIIPCTSCNISLDQYIQRYWLIFCHFYGKQSIWIHINEDTEYCLISCHLNNNNMSPHHFLLFLHYIGVL